MLNNKKFAVNNKYSMLLYILKKAIIIFIIAYTVKYLLVISANINVLKYIIQYVSIDYLPFIAFFTSFIHLSDIPFDLSWLKEFIRHHIDNQKMKVGLSQDTPDNFHNANSSKYKNKYINCMDKDPNTNPSGDKDPNAYPSDNKNPNAYPSGKDNSSFSGPKKGPNYSTSENQTTGFIRDENGVPTFNYERSNARVLLNSIDLADSLNMIPEKKVETNLHNSEGNNYGKVEINVTGGSHNDILVQNGTVYDNSDYRKWKREGTMSNVSQPNPALGDGWRNPEANPKSESVKESVKTSKPKKGDK